MSKIVCYLFSVIVAAYPAVYGQFPQAIAQPMTAVPPTQREGKWTFFERQNKIEYK